MTKCADYGVRYSRGGCSWLSVGGDRFTQDESLQNRAYRDVGAHVQGGLSHSLGTSRLVAAVAGSYETVHTRLNGAAGTGDRYQLGLSIGYHGGSFDAAAYGTFGHASIAVTRLVETPSAASIASRRQRFNFEQLGGTLGYTVTAGSLSLRPALEGGFSLWEQQRVVESGASMVSLSLQNPGTKGFGFVKPGISATETFDLGSVRMGASVKGGYMRRFGETSVEATFTGAPIAAAPFTTRSFLDRDAGTVGAALHADLGHGVSLQASYDGEFGRRTTEHSFWGRSASPSDAVACGSGDDEAVAAATVTVSSRSWSIGDRNQYGSRAHAFICPSAAAHACSGGGRAVENERHHRRRHAQQL